MLHLPYANMFDYLLKYPCLCVSRFTYSIPRFCNAIELSQFKLAFFNIKNKCVISNIIIVMHISGTIFDISRNC